MREMKDSGIEWIGQIPKEWDILRLKYCFSGFTNGTSDTQLSSGESLYPVTRIETISSGEINLDKIGYVAFSKKQYLLKTGDILVSNINSIKYLGNCAVVRDGYRLYHGMNLLRVVPGDYIDNGYAYYLFKSNVFKFPMEKYCKPAINQASVSATTMKNFFIPFPDLVVQQQIANFLDTKCSEIDATAEDIQKEISLLEDYKKSVITEAVTKGLNPDAEMKDSGIEWIGEIPKDWEVHPVYVYFEEGKTKNYRLQEQNLLSLSYGRIIRKDINTNGGLLPASFNTYNVINAGDIIIRPTDLQNDKRSLRTGLVKEQGIITSAYIDLRPKDNVNSAYYHYLLHSYDIIKVFYNMGNGVRQGLNFSEFAKLLLLEPTTVEQQQIADYLDSKCSEIDALITDKKRQLDILADYKKSLIYEYVTGKKEVPVNE